MKLSECASLRPLPCILLRAFALGLVFTALICALPCADACAAFDKAQEEGPGEKLAPEFEKTITALLDASAGGNLPPEEELFALARYMMSTSTIPEDVRLEKREYGEGAFVRQNMRLPLEKLLRYCFDPEVPAEVIYPMVLRRSFWLPENPLLQGDQKLWAMAGAQKGIALRGTEFEEISPDSFSGCYYSYNLHRLVVPLDIDGKAVLISVSRQTAPSTVGRKGAIAGDDKNWNYVYSNVIGSNLKLVGWAETFMYGSASVAVMYQNGEDCALGLFKWVNAGWSGMNMVNSKHIRSGGERFLFSMRQVLESPALPAPEEIAEQRKKLDAMSDSELREAFAPHAALLAQAGQNGGDLASGDFKKLFEGDYAGQLERANLVSELMKLYMKERLGIKDAPVR